MKAQLRIGNIVSYEATAHVIYELLFNRVIHHWLKNPNEAYSSHYEHIEGFPLTDEWLIRFGFEKVNHIHGYSFYNHKKNKVDIYENKTLYMGYIVNHCANVHQLQNLVHSLTGNELELVKK